MNKDAQWWKEYRVKNSEKLRAYKRDRYHASKRSVSSLEASKQIDDGKAPCDVISPPKPIPEPIRRRTCQISFCRNTGRPVLVQGINAWLCEDHS
jgi:hypothetical protein